MLPLELMENASSLMNFGYIQRTWLTQHVELIAKKYKLKNSDLTLLYLLHFNKSVKTAKDITKFSELKRGNISLIVETLTCKGYITQSSIKGDRRMKKLELTTKCKPILEEVDEVINNLLKIMMEGISDEEINVLRTAVRKMYENMQKEDITFSEEK